MNYDVNCVCAQPHSIVRINWIGIKEKEKKQMTTDNDKFNSLALVLGRRTPSPARQPIHVDIACDGVCFNLFNFVVLFFFVSSTLAQPALFTNWNWTEEMYIQKCCPCPMPVSTAIAIYWNINFIWMETNVKTIYYYSFTLNKMCVRPALSMPSKYNVCPHCDRPI